MSQSRPEARVELLGGFCVTAGGARVPDNAWRLRKARTLVKLLALAPGHRLHREQVGAVLWPGRDAPAAANNLHQVLHVARRAGLDVRLADDVLVLAAAQLDTEAFRAAALAALRSGDADRAAGALALYGGPLLPEDLYEEWTEPARGELERLRDELAALAVPKPSQRDNLPAEATTFVGRESELEELARLLGRGPLVTVTGPAGCGKTRLALEAAARARAGFRDGVWLVELAPLADGALLAGAVAAAVGVQPAEALAERLAGRELLIVLDNCEHLVAAAEALAERLVRRCPHVQLLVTSREALELPGEIVHRIAPLGPEDSVRLFADRARAARPGFALTAGNTADVERICRRLDGVPLAIELAAGRVGTLPPAELADRLAVSLKLLRGRRQTLAGALDWSFRALDAEEAELLRGLAVFAGSFGIDAVEAVGGEDAVLVLVRLVGKSLVVADGSRFRLLEMVREHAAEWLEAVGEAERRRERHARFYLHLAEEAPPERLDLESEDLRAALGWLLAADPPGALRLAGALRAWWLLRGRLAEGMEWLERAVARTPQRSAEVAAALLRAVPFAGRAAGFEESGRLAERGLDVYRELGDRAGTARALHSVGLQRWLRGDYAGARARLDEAAAQADGASSLAANAVHALGVVAVATREPARARALFERTLELLPRDAGFWVVTPGPQFAPHGAAVRLVPEESQIVIRRVAGRRAASAYVQLNLAVVARLEGDTEQAGDRVAEALEGLRAEADEAGAAQALAAAGRLAILAGDAARAHRALRDSLVLRRRLGDVRGVGLSLGLLAELAAAGGDVDHARSLLERALATFAEASDRPGLLWMEIALGQLELDAGAPHAARPHLESALASAERLAARAMRGWTLALHAEADLETFGAARAGRRLAEARRDFTACGDPWGLERCDVLAAALA